MRRVAWFPPARGSCAILVLSLLSCSRLHGQLTPSADDSTELNTRGGEEKSNAGESLIVTEAEANFLSLVRQLSEDGTISPTARRAALHAAWRALPPTPADDVATESAAIENTYLERALIAPTVDPVLPPEVNAYRQARQSFAAGLVQNGVLFRVKNPFVYRENLLGYYRENAAAASDLARLGAEAAATEKLVRGNVLVRESVAVVASGSGLASSDTTGNIAAIDAKLKANPTLAAQLDSENIYERRHAMQLLFQRTQISIQTISSKLTP